MTIRTSSPRIRQAKFDGSAKADLYPRVQDTPHSRQAKFDGSAKADLYPRVQDTPPEELFRASPFSRRRRRRGITLLGGEHDASRLGG